MREVVGLMKLGTLTLLAGAPPPLCVTLPFALGFSSPRVDLGAVYFTRFFLTSFLSSVFLAE